MEWVKTHSFKREFSTQSVGTSFRVPMSPYEKRKLKLRRMLCCLESEPTAACDSERGNSAEKLAYKVKSDKSTSAVSMSAASWLTEYLNWSFETGFLQYFLSAILLYLIIAFIFALLLMWAENTALNPCISGYPHESEFFVRLSGAFTLSWTTLSTVGYGQIYPEIQEKCMPENFLTSVESLCGVLYAGFCSAILFGKVQHIYSRASVIFSQCCVMRYGAGCGGYHEEDDDENHVFNEDDIDDIGPQDSRGQPMKERNSVPHPFLLFRIVNKKANYILGNICNVDIRASVVKETSEISLTSRANGKGNPSKRRFFQTVQIEPSSVPLFDKIVFVRHILDKHSPLLNYETRRLIRKNKGRWPIDINSPEEIRSCLNFAQMIISLEGLSDTSRSNVYAIQTYIPEDIKIGWRFVDMMYETRVNNKLQYRVDFDLVDVIEEQAEGQGDDLTGDNVSVVDA